jgi:hypothetical protein
MPTAIGGVLTDVVTRHNVVNSMERENQPTWVKHREARGDRRPLRRPKPRRPRSAACVPSWFFPSVLIFVGALDGFPPTATALLRFRQAPRDSFRMADGKPPHYRTLVPTALGSMDSRSHAATSLQTSKGRVIPNIQSKSGRERTLSAAGCSLSTDHSISRHDELKFLFWLISAAVLVSDSQRISRVTVNRRLYGTKEFEAETLVPRRPPLHRQYSLGRRGNPNDLRRLAVVVT